MVEYIREKICMIKVLLSIVILMQVVQIAVIITFRNQDYNINLAQSLQLADIQRSVGSFDSLMAPLVNNYGASRVTLFRLQYKETGQAQNITDMNLVNVSQINRDDIAPSKNLGLTRSLSAYRDILPKLIAHQAVAKYVDEMQDGTLKDLAIANKILFIIWIDISDKDGNLLGVLAAGWTQEDSIPKDEVLTRTFRSMRDTTISLSHNFNNSVFR